MNIIKSKPRRHGCDWQLTKPANWILSGSMRHTNIHLYTYNKCKSKTNPLLSCSNWRPAVAFFSYTYLPSENNVDILCERHCIKVCPCDGNKSNGWTMAHSFDRLLWEQYQFRDTIFLCYWLSKPFQKCHPSIKTVTKVHKGKM